MSADGASGERAARRRATLRMAAVHAAVVIGGWLFATLIYAIAISKTRELGWIGFDAALIAACAGVVHHHRDALGFRALGARRGAKLAGLILLGTACALAVQLAIRDRNGIWLDESHYLATVRAGHIIRDGRMPFNLRWLMPLLAGRWNLLPVDDIQAVKALNFGAFAVTTWLLILLLVRLRVRLGLALTAPVFLLCSYLGIYGASNRLVLDAFNYAMYVVLFHLVLRRDHAWLFGLVLLISACNAEKAVYWVPVFGLVAILRGEPAAADRPARPWWALHRHPALRLASWCCAPTVLYLIAIRFYLAGSTTEWNLCFENIDVMSLSPLGAEIHNELVKPNTFQALWLPFGPFTIFALLGFRLADRWLKPVALLLIPIFIQNLIACDGERMVAYTFIVYLPFGYLYLANALAALPRALGRGLLGGSVAIALAGHYLFPVLARWKAVDAAALIAARDPAKLVLSAIELALVGALLFVHFTFYDSPRPNASSNP